MSSVTEEQVMGWSVEEVASRLVEERVEDDDVILFMENNVDGKALLALNTEEKLIELGVKAKTSRKAILTFLASLSSSFHHSGAIQYSSNNKAHGDVPVSCNDQ